MDWVDDIRVPKPGAKAMLLINRKMQSGKSAVYHLGSWAATVLWTNTEVASGWATQATYSRYARNNTPSWVDDMATYLSTWAATSLPHLQWHSPACFGQLLRGGCPAPGNNGRWGRARR